MCFMWVVNFFSLSLSLTLLSHRRWQLCDKVDHIQLEIRLMTVDSCSNHESIDGELFYVIGHLIWWRHCLLQMVFIPLYCLYRQCWVVYFKINLLSFLPVAQIRRKCNTIPGIAGHSLSILGPCLITIPQSSVSFRFPFRASAYFDWTFCAN